MPALALADALRRARPDVEPVLVGARRGIEADVLPRYPFRHHLLSLEPLYRRAWWRNARWPLVLWRLPGELRRLVATEHPALVVGTGGYAAGPVVWWAQRAGIPTALQEQNALPGLTTRWLARGARQVHLGFPEARARLRPGPGTAVFSLGNPIRPPDPGPAGAARTALGLAPDRPTVLAFGGSQGARAINKALADALDQGAFSEINLLWGTGPAHAPGLVRYAVPGRVTVRGFFDPMTLAYRAADLLVCRAGAMTTAELCAWGKPSVLVPLPTAAADHQTHNALALAAAGAALLMMDRDLTGASLAGLVRDLLSSPTRLASIGRAASARGNPNAARDVVSRILTLIQ
jgi:UDP-N-acetylglucosamine--N-acetylmuramyl-(pentapeptide) pyrophosphoryl-undecaprenol N-acetylglucosamine transferase